MPVPPMTLAVEPAHSSGRAYYLPIAPKSTGHPAYCKVVLRLKMTNAHPTDALRLTSIEFTFPGTGHAAQPMKGVAIAMDAGVRPDPNDGVIPHGGTATWSNGVVDLDTSKEGKNSISNALYLEMPPPRKVKVWIRCAGYSEARTHTMDLLPYTDATGRGAFILPFAPYDLKLGEYIVTSAQHWSNGGASGTQIFAHDIAVEAFSGGRWTALRHGRKGDTNDDHRIHGLPVRAMADGVVLPGAKTDTPENPKPGEKLDIKPLEGNHLWLQHGDVKVKYTHFQPHTIPARLLVAGAAVRAGEQIALAGNSGNSDGPHLHIECVAMSNGSLRGIPFKDGWVVARSLITKDQGGPWVRLSGQGSSRDTVALWPATTAPQLVLPMVGIARSGDWSNAYWVSESGNTFAQEIQNAQDQQGLRLVSAASYLERGHRRWIGIARSGSWANSVWTNNDRASFEAEAQRLHDDLGRRPTFVTTWREGSARRWFGIARSGDWDCSMFIHSTRSAFERTAQRLFDTRGLRLTHVTSYPVGSSRHWVGIARSGDWSSRFIAGDTLQSFAVTVQDELDRHGRRLTHVHSYRQGSQRRWVGITRSGDWSFHFLAFSDIDSFSRHAQNIHDEQGCRLAQALPLTDED